MKIIVFNQEAIQKAIVSEPHIVISIQDPACKHVILPKLKSRKDILQLKFHDVDDIYIANFQEWTKERQIIPFTVSHAQAILSFVNDWKDKVDIILVNCCAGISRSAGVSGALSNILNGEDEYYFKHYCPNRYVYRLILEENEKEINPT